mmetsp:Transcript_34627/g.35316  ORF Transcript_34627/g.35316 Transcript_34627/m.35316 type:complete len:203 (+) Transcript_34627:85-693(+)
MSKVTISENKILQDAMGTTFTKPLVSDHESTYRGTFNESSMQESDTKRQNNYAKFKEYKESGNIMTRELHSDKKQSSALVSSDHFKTTQEDYGPRSRVSRTEYLKLHSADAPAAIGRSGLREERGLTGSGLSGEKYRTLADPALNSFAQRSWMYADDPALTYRRDGVPHTPDIDYGNTLQLRPTRSAAKTDTQQTEDQGICD